MPTFLAKVFSRGKDKDKGKDGPGLKEPAAAGAPTSKKDKRASRASAQSLLEGKFENVSPSVTQFEERDSVLAKEGKEKEGGKDKEKEKSALFRPKSRTTSGNGVAFGAGARKVGGDPPPQLTLDLNLSPPGATSDARRRDLSVVYEGDAVLDDATLGARSLSPKEALGLMRACLGVLTSRGLDTLGIMHPHWHSASPATQRKIISLFLSTATPAPAPAPPTSALSPPTNAASDSAFETELGYVRSPHDVAAVFRWALRHLRLDGDAFDTNTNTNTGTPSLAWYDRFSSAEKEKGYPPTAYSDLLVPGIKPEHAALLETTLSLVSRLASHSEVNGVSGSKLSMFLGHYLLTGNKVENLKDWIAFYEQWERAGRALEHIFLASLRDEESKTPIPKRLSELIVNYPYSKFATDNQFPRPARFATRAYDALYVRITFESAPGTRAREEVHLPLQIVENALKADAVEGTGDANAELVALWEEVRKTEAGTGVGTGGAEEESVALDKALSSVLSDESIRILSLKNDGADKGTPTISMFTPVPEHEPLFGSPTSSPRANGKAKAANGSTSISRQTTEGSSTSSPILADWSTFSSAGFGESSAGQSLAATLLDSDLEKTEPVKVAPHKSLKKSRSPGRASRSAMTKSASGRPTSPTPTEPESPRRFKTTRVELVKLDESFIDFWSDAVVDPISSAWPAFVVCQLKADAVRTYGDKKLAWLVVEQKFLAPPQPPMGEPSSPVRRASSPRPSVRSENEGTRPGVVGRVSATFSTSRKRFNFFGGQTTAAASATGSEKRESKAFGKGAGTGVNEMGEVVPVSIPEGEVVSSPPPPPASKAAPTPEKAKEEAVPKKDADKVDSAKVGAAALAVGAGAVAVVADATASALAPEAENSISEEVPKEQNGQAVKEESADITSNVTDVPSKEGDGEPAVGEAELAAEEPALVSAAEPEQEQEPEQVVQDPTDEPQSQVADADADVPQAEIIHDDVEPEDSLSEVAPVAPEPESAAVAEASEVPAAVPVPAPVSEVAEPQDSATEAEAETETESEEPVGSAHHGHGAGAGESRFVEHIETPPDEKTTGVEPSVNIEQAAGPVEEADVLPTVSEVAEPEQEQEQVESAPAAESAPSAAVEEEKSVLPIVEDSTAPSSEGAVEPAHIEPTHVPVEADEPTTQVADESKGDALPIGEESTPAPSAEPTAIIVEERDEQPTSDMAETTPLAPEEEEPKEVDSGLPVSQDSQEPRLANGEAPAEATPAAVKPHSDSADVSVHEPTDSDPSKVDSQPADST